jgi:predicted dehydrogenase
MNLTPEQQAQGRRNFLRVLAGTPALAALAAASASKGPLRGGPVRLGFVGLGSEGRVLLEQTPKAYAEVRALCDINPTQLGKADEVLAKTGHAPARHYVEWREMLQKEDIEGVVVATPLWMHAEVSAGCLEAGKHVLCEKMMAWDEAGCELMRNAARQSKRLLEIGYQRHYNPVYQATYDGIIRAGALGDVYHARLVWHRNGNWRRQATPPTPDYDPSRWGYPTFDHLANWRLFRRYSRGLLAELASHQVSVADWFFGASAEAVSGSGGLFRFPGQGREVYDHVYATFEYPQGRTAVFSAIESNAYDHYYEMFMGTKATLILRGETEAYLFDENDGKRPTGIEMTPKGSGSALEASESRSADAAGSASGSGGAQRVEKTASYRLEIEGFCAAVRTGKALACGPDKAFESARACLRADEAIEKKTRLTL